MLCVNDSVSVKNNNNNKQSFWITLLVRMIINSGVGDLLLGLPSKALSVSEAVSSSTASTPQVNQDGKGLR